MKSSLARSAARVSSSATAVAERGLRSNSASSPKKSPGRMIATSASWPNSPGSAIFTAPSSTRYRCVPGSSLRKMTSARLYERGRMRAARSASSSGDRRANSGKRRSRSTITPSCTARTVARGAAALTMDGALDERWQYSHGWQEPEEAEHRQQAEVALEEGEPRAEARDGPREAQLAALVQDEQEAPPPAAPLPSSRRSASDACGSCACAPGASPPAAFG